MLQTRISERVGLSGEHIEGHLEYAIEDCGWVTRPKSRRGESSGGDPGRSDEGTRGCLSGRVDRDGTSAVI